MNRVNSTNSIESLPKTTVVKNNNCNSLKIPQNTQNDESDHLDVADYGEKYQVNIQRSINHLDLTKCESKIVGPICNNRTCESVKFSNFDMVGGLKIRNFRSQSSQEAEIISHGVGIEILFFF